MSPGVQRFHRPETLEQAWRLKLETPDAQFLAGGTDLMVRIREGGARPTALISLARVAELSGLEAGPPWRIGAAARVANLLEEPVLRAQLPVLAQAARTLGSPQIRSSATVGGNLCNASPCADLAPPLLVLDARVQIVGPEGAREMALESFFVAPGETRLGPAELLRTILVDAPAPGQRAVFLKRGRVAMDLSVASLAFACRLEGGALRGVRVAVGSVAPRPVRLPGVEGLLEGQVPTPAVVARAREAAEAQISPISDLRGSAWYRRALIGALLAKAIAQVTKPVTGEVTEQATKEAGP